MGAWGPETPIFECRASAFFSLHSFKLMLKFQVWYQFEAKHLWINFCPTGKHFDNKNEILGGTRSLNIVAPRTFIFFIPYEFTIFTTPTSYQSLTQTSERRKDNPRDRLIALPLTPPLPLPRPLPRTSSYPCSHLYSYLCHYLDLCPYPSSYSSPYSCPFPNFTTAPIPTRTLPLPIPLHMPSLYFYRYSCPYPYLFFVPTPTIKHTFLFAPSLPRP